MPARRRAVTAGDGVAWTRPSRYAVRLEMTGLRIAWWLTAGAALLASAAAACSAVTGIAADGADFGGAKADAYCDRRFVDAGGTPSAFCQEVLSTVAASEFADDCRTKHLSATGPGLCPRPHIIAGCKLHDAPADHSNVYDWYYDVSYLVGDASADGGVEAGGFDARARTVSDVAAMCSDPTRYEQGADLVFP